MREAGRTAEAADIFLEAGALAGKKSDRRLAELRRTAALEAVVTLATGGRVDEAKAARQRLLDMPGVTEAQREQAEAAIRMHSEN